MTGAPEIPEPPAVPAEASHTEPPIPHDVQTVLDALTGISNQLTAINGKVDQIHTAAARAADEALALRQELAEWRRVEGLDKAHVLERLNAVESKFRAIAAAAE